MRPTTRFSRLISSAAVSQEAFLAQQCRATRSLCAHPQRISTSSHSASPFQSRTPSIRTFTSTPSCLKKGSKAARSSSADNASSTTPATAGAAEDPFDFSALEADLSKSIERLRADLSKLRSGGRFNPEVLENLKVTLGKNEGGAVVKVGDIAQVVPKGRIVQIVVGETEHLKPLTSAILSSPSLNLTPQPDATNPLLLNLPIPPPTAESRNQALAAAQKAGDAANLSIRNARQACQKKLRAMQLAKTARPDDLKKAGTLMEKVVEKGTGEVKKIVEGARKVLDS